MSRSSGWPRERDPDWRGLAYLCRSLKPPSLAEAAARLAERARSETWTHAVYLVACLEREVAARESHGGEAASGSPGSLPARRSRTSTSSTRPRSAGKSSPILEPSTSSKPATTSSSSGPLAPGRPHIAIRLCERACQAGHRVDLAAAAHSQGRFQAELVHLGRNPPLDIDEVGNIPFETEAANLIVQLASPRYGRASVIVTSNKPFGRWGEVFGDATRTEAMIDSLVHHATVVSQAEPRRGPRGTNHQDRDQRPPCPGEVR